MYVKADEILSCTMMSGGIPVFWCGTCVYVKADEISSCTVMSGGIPVFWCGGVAITPWCSQQLALSAGQYQH